MNEQIDIFKELLWDSIIRKGLAALFAKIPLLGWGPIGYVLTFFIMKWSDQIYELVVEFIDVSRIVFKNETLQKEYDKASVRLKLVAKGFGWTSPEFEEARDANREHLSNFVRFDNFR